MQILDLSHAIKHHMPVYPGDPLVDLEVTPNYDKEGFRDYKLASSVHVGTHIDAPSHMIENGKNFTNLKDLVGKTFEFQALPLKLENDGAPVCAIARVSE